MADMDKHIIVEALPQSVQNDCPIDFKYYSIAKNQNDESLFARICLINLSRNPINAIKIALHCFDSFGELIDPDEQPVRVTMQDLSIPVRSEFLSYWISLGNSQSTRIVEMQVEKILFVDGTYWTAKNFDKATVKSIKLPNKEIQDQIKAKAGSDAIVFSLVDEHGWLCVCGKYNNLEKTECDRCGRNKIAVTSSLSQSTINYDRPQNIEKVQKTEINNTVRFENERPAQIFRDEKTRKPLNNTQHKKLLNDNKNNKGSKILKLSIAVVLILGLVTSIIGWYVFPFIKYEYAIFIFNQKRFSEAQELFESMGNFKESEKNVDLAISEQLYIDIEQGKYQIALNKIANLSNSTKVLLGIDEVKLIEALCRKKLRDYSGSYSVLRTSSRTYRSNRLNISNKDLIVEPVNALYRQEIGYLNNFLNVGLTYMAVNHLKEINQMRLELARYGIYDIISEKEITEKFEVIKLYLLEESIPDYYVNTIFLSKGFLKTGTSFNGGTKTSSFKKGSSLGLVADGIKTRKPLLVKWYRLKVDYLSSEVKNELVAEHTATEQYYPGYHFYFINNYFEPGQFYYAELIEKSYIETVIGTFPFQIEG